MRVECRQRDLMLHAERRDPHIVFWDRLALCLQSKPNGCIHGRCRGRNVEDAAPAEELLDVGEVLGSATGVQSAVSELSDNRYWKKKLFDGLREKRPCLPGENGNGGACIQRYAIATHGNRPARTRAR